MLGWICRYKRGKCMEAIYYTGAISAKIENAGRDARVENPDDAEFYEKK